MVDPLCVRRNIDLIPFELPPQPQRNEEHRYLPPVTWINRQIS